jgi:hypothetical protein
MRLVWAGWRIQRCLPNLQCKERETAERCAGTSERRSVIEKGQKRLDSVAYPASRFAIGPQTLAAQIEKRLGGREPTKPSDSDRYRQ